VCDFNFRNQFPDCHETYNEHYANGGTNAVLHFLQLAITTQDPHMQNCEVGMTPAPQPLHPEMTYGNRPCKNTQPLFWYCFWKT
jgi:hypothetical protein